MSKGFHKTEKRWFEDGICLSLVSLHIIWFEHTKILFRLFINKGPQAKFNYFSWTCEMINWENLTNPKTERVGSFTSFIFYNKYMKGTQHIETLLIFKYFYTLWGWWPSTESKVIGLFVSRQRGSMTVKRKQTLETYSSNQV